jgi:hypothetical protein
MPQTPASHNLSSGEETVQAPILELPFCIYNLPNRFEVYVSRPFRPFDSKKKIPIQTCDELEDAVSPKYLLTLGGPMPEHLDWDQAKLERG